MTPEEKAFTSRWHAKPNDVIGGWCVMPVDESPSEGHWEVCDFMSETAARHVAELHNAWLAEMEYAARLIPFYEAFGKAFELWRDGLPDV